jgi:hypothetical protein
MIQKKTAWLTFVLIDRRSGRVDSFKWNESFGGAKRLTIMDTRWLGMVQQIAFASFADDLLCGGRAKLYYALWAVYLFVIAADQRPQTRQWSNVLLIDKPPDPSFSWRDCAENISRKD